ncbi:hypothetical protein [Cupriavidus basilensis]|nr:hypothetical protein [Cupriavidus basilensis]
MRGTFRSLNNFNYRLVLTHLTYKNATFVGVVMALQFVLKPKA